MTVRMVPAPHWQVKNEGDCSKIIGKGIAEGLTDIKVEADITE
ncbi:protein of unknown function [Nitrosotalea devaniterrae]|uniref:Uncharacterized protein n=1 Tax=Nitrosotalea devaniterrae TaxID=1078905 RepID=A0A128A647_9ARCH|nr:protein of unknown function [Candidatus Nitrosotalea devanaterra]